MREFTGAQIDGWLSWGERLRDEQADARETPDRRTAVWYLMREAVTVSRSWPGPPRSGLPSRSSWPGYRDDVSEWLREWFAYEQGVSSSEMYDRPARPIYTAHQHEMAEMTLRLFHAHALTKAPDRDRLRWAVLAYAGGQHAQKIRKRFGLDRFRLARAKRLAVEDMLIGMRKW